MQSRDGFSKSRSDDFLGFLVQSGGTDMVDYNRWAALDTMAVELPLPWPLPDIDIPVGWGGAQAVESYRNQRFLNGFGNGNGWYSDWDRRRYRPYGEAVRRNRGAAWIVDRSQDANVRFANGQHRKAFFTGYNGLRDYHDVKAGQALQPYAENDRDRDKVGPVFTIYAETAGASAHHLRRRHRAPPARRWNCRTRWPTTRSPHFPPRRCSSTVRCSCACSAAMTASVKPETCSVLTGRHDWSRPMPPPRLPWRQPEP
jgi:hypothetical protein